MAVVSQERFHCIPSVMGLYSLMIFSTQTDTFNLEAVDLGPIQKILIGHDGEGSGSGWHLDRVTVTAEGEEGEKEFPCGRYKGTVTQILNSAS